MSFQLTPLTSLVLGGPEQRAQAAVQIRTAVTEAGGNMKQAARALRVSRATLYNYCGRLGLFLEERAGRQGQKGGGKT